MGLYLIQKAYDKIKFMTKIKAPTLASLVQWRESPLAD